MEKQDIVLLYGGRSGEHEVSLRSAAFVYSNIDVSRFDVTVVGIAKSGIWYQQSRDIEPENGIMPLTEDPSQTVSLSPGIGLKGPDGLPCRPLVFPVLHGSFGEDGTLQGALELACLPYVGADVLGCALSMDKEMIKRVWQDEGLPVVPFRALRKSRWQDPEFEVSRFLEEELSPFGFPLFVKPANTGSSLGVSRVDDPEGLSAALEEAFQYDLKLLVEPCVDAREIECSVIGNGPVESFEVGEIVSTHTFYDYKAKYIDPEGARLLIPAPIDRSLDRTIRDIAERAYSSAGISGFARVDFFLNNRDGKVYLNELNAIPGFTSISMFPMMCREGGLTSRELIGRLIEMGLKRHGEKERLKFSC